MTSTTPHVVFAGGGTAGHLCPGLAVAEQLQAISPETRITIATGVKPLERQLTLAAGFDHLALPSRGLPRDPRGAWRFVADNFSGLRAAQRYVRAEGVSLVVGLGGYASVPMAWAATNLKLPLVLLEQNAVPGKTTRWFAPRASLICTAFEEAAAGLRSAGPIRVTGNPIRSGFDAVRHNAIRPARLRRASSRLDCATVGARGAPSLPRAERLARRQLLVLGGSGGARQLNEQVPRALYKLGAALRGWRIVHQTGPRDRDATAELYRKLAIRALTVSFIDRLPPLLHGADLVISRAGGATLSELAASGAPALLIPYPHAAGDHQRRNAQAYVAAGAAAMVDPREIPGRLDDALAETLTPLVDNSPARAAMSRAMRELSRPDAAWHVATMIAQLLEPTGRLAESA